MLQLQFFHFLQEGFPFFPMKFSIFSSGFLRVWSSDVWFFINTVHLHSVYTARNLLLLTVLLTQF